MASIRERLLHTTLRCCHWLLLSVQWTSNLEGKAAFQNHKVMILECSFPSKLVPSTKQYCGDQRLGRITCFEDCAGYLQALTCYYVPVFIFASHAMSNTTCFFSFFTEALASSSADRPFALTMMTKSLVLLAALLKIH